MTRSIASIILCFSFIKSYSSAIIIIIIIIFFSSISLFPSSSSSFTTSFIRLLLAQILCVCVRYSVTDSVWISCHWMSCCYLTVISSTSMTTMKSCKQGMKRTSWCRALYDDQSLKSLQFFIKALFLGKWKTEMWLIHKLFWCADVDESLHLYMRNFLAH
jgi:hypothetical protein